MDHSQPGHSEYQARIKELEDASLVLVKKISALNAHVEMLEAKIAPVPAFLFETWKGIRDRRAEVHSVYDK